MAHPYCTIEEAAFGQFCNRLLVALAGVDWIFCLDEQKRYLTVQIGIIRFVLDDLSIEFKRFSLLAQASPTGCSRRFFQHQASIVRPFAVKQRHQYNSVALHGCPIFTYPSSLKRFQSFFQAFFPVIRVRSAATSVSSM